MADQFSGVFDKLIGVTKQATDGLNKLDDATTLSEPQQAVRELNRELDRLRAKGRAGTLTLTDVKEFQNAQGALRNLQGGLDDIAGKGAKTNVIMGQLAATVVSLGAGFGLMQITRASSEMLRMGAESTALGEALDGLGARAGVNGRAIVEEIQKASDGTISSVQAMQVVNRQFMSDNKALAASLPDLFRVADASAKALGQDVGQTFEQLISAVSSGQTRQLRTIGLYIDSEAALSSYAKSIGKATADLTLADKQMAIFNATMEAGIPLIEATGSAAADASDQLASLPVAIGEAKQAVGELLVEMGGAEAAGDFASGISTVTEQLRQYNQFKAVRAKIIEAGDIENANRFTAEMRVINQELAATPPWATPDEMQAAVQVAIRSRDELIAKMNESMAVEATERQAAEGIVGAYEGAARGAQAWASALAEQQAAMAAAAPMQDAFNDSIAQTRESLIGIASVAANLGTLKETLAIIGDVRMPEMPEMPKVTGPLLTIDTEGLRAYLQQLAQVKPALAEAQGGKESLIQATLNEVAAVEAEQDAMIGSAFAIHDNAAGLQILATGAFGAGAGILDLVGKFGQLSPRLQQAALDLGLMTQAIGALQRQANAPITLDVAVTGLEQGYAQIDALALRVAKVQGPEASREFRARARQDLETHWKQMGQTDKFGLDLLVQGQVDSWGKVVSNQEDAQRKSEQSLKTHGANMARDSGAIRSQIENALRAGLEVTPTDVAAAQAGNYQEKALEAARQLQAIAERGFAEIQAHPDWAAALKIPPEVLSGSEAQLKAWAAQTQTQVANLARPDLINWDAFIANFKQGLQDTAAQELTIDIALGKLDEAGLLGGRSKEQAREDVKQALGLGEPQITFESYFAPAAGETPQTVTDSWVAANGVPTVPVQFAAQQATGEAGTPIPTGVAVVEGQLAALPAVNPAALAQAGTDLAGGLYASFEAAVKAQDVGGLTAVNWMASFANQAVQFQNIGISAGAAVGTGFMAALEGKVGDARRRIAELVAPEVAAILRVPASGTLP